MTRASPTSAATLDRSAEEAAGIDIANGDACALIQDIAELLNRSVEPEAEDGFDDMH